LALRYPVALGHYQWLIAISLHSAEPCGAKTKASSSNASDTQTFLETPTNDPVFDTQIKPHLLIRILGMEASSLPGEESADRGGYQSNHFWDHAFSCA
jgi:hypothetical protein